MDNNNSLRITRKLVRERLQSYTRDSYVYLYGLVKGIALAAATYAILAVLDSGERIPEKLVLWVASGGAVLVSHVTASAGALLSSHRFNFLDTLLPVLVGLIEFLLFGILAPPGDHPDWWQHWYLLFAIHALVAAGLVTNRFYLTDVEAEFDPDLRDLATAYIHWLRGNVIGAVLVGLAFVMAWVFVQLSPWGDSGSTVHFVLGSVALLSVVPVIREAEHQRARIVMFVFGKTDPQSGGAV